MIQEYYHLIKPGIVRANTMTAAAGFLLAAKGVFEWSQLGATALGMACVVASACVVNNYADRHIDKRMKRTKKRALVTGAISPQRAFVFAATLAIIGFGALSSTTTLAMVTAGLGVVAYLGLYGYAKRHTVYSTLIGSISGAIPPVVGYVAVMGAYDTAAFLLFVILAAWQMPHFYAIAIFRMDDYANAKLPILSVKEGIAKTKQHIVAFIPLFIITALLLSFFGITGWVYAVVMTLLGLWWLGVAIYRFNDKDDNTWAHRVFGVSLAVLLGFSVMISVDWLLF